MKNILNAIIPISKLNKGDIDKIFDDVNITGTKVVIKKNKPICVMLSLKEYEEMIATIEIYQSMVDKGTISADKIMLPSESNSEGSHSDSGEDDGE